jgi:prepilin-type N-terminal cleavage/methylation domain-containing protein
MTPRLFTGCSPGADLNWIARCRLLTVRCQRGFSLLEVLIATTLAASALIGLGQLVALAIDANRHAQAATIVTLLAQQKMEELRSFAWSVDVLGVAATDSRLSPSPGNTLNENVDGFCDFADASGRPLGETSPMPAGAVYVRRWSIEPLPAFSGNVLAVQVLVTPRLVGHSQPGPARSRMPDEAHLVAIRRRVGI